MNVLTAVLAGLAVLLTLIGMGAKAVRTITKDNSDGNAQTETLIRSISKENSERAAKLETLFTTRFGELQAEIRAIQERHTAAADKVDEVIMPLLTDHEKRLRNVEYGSLLHEVLEFLQRGRGSKALIGDRA